MAKTEENLQAAFAGESQANRRYLAFAKKAEEDGKPGVATLFRAAAEAETIHAHAHFDLMGGVKTTAENVEAAIAGETYEYTEMYPEFKEAATGEEAAEAEFLFGLIGKVEEVHAGLYSRALEAVKAGKDLEADSVWVCDQCGNVVLGAPPDKCPICAAEKRFRQVQ